jgi:protein-S-isoprenylcysteine O-methyltransferase Ste14
MIIRVQALELKVPPPVVLVLAAGAMWAIARVAPPLEVPTSIRWLTAGAIALAGFALNLAGIVAFRRAKTTVNPMRPENASSLVDSGVYRVSRNPMYAGLLVVLVAWAVFLSSAWALLGPVLFVFYMNRFQIEPEERVLSAMFGARYADYKAQVRRWL